MAADRPVLAIAAVSYTLPDAAAATGISETTIRQAITDRDLVAHYVGRRATKPVVRAIDLDEWVASLPTERRKAS